ncbi:MAG: hypothetical protein MUF86_03285 [Akkermansiaceae bacterium]|nr:hypothetical protein [Akkermansiaceae bacterium]
MTRWVRVDALACRHAFLEIRSSRTQTQPNPTQIHDHAFSQKPHPRRLHGGHPRHRNPPAQGRPQSHLQRSFTINFQALGTIADTFDPSDFTGGAATGIHSSTNATWAVNSDLNTQANNVPGQGIVFTFDFTNLVGASAG